jgi:hypothetical protein
MNTGVRLRENTVKYANIGVWLTGAILILPFNVSGQYEAASRSCKHEFDSNQNKAHKVYKVFLTVIVVFIPFFVICFCYSQILRELYFKNKTGPQNVVAQEEASEKCKLFKLSVTVTFVFVIFLFPLAINIGMKFFDNREYSYYSKFALMAFFLHSGINPLVYAFRSTNFRQAFKEILRFRA